MTWVSWPRPPSASSVMYASQQVEEPAGGPAVRQPAPSLYRGPARGPAGAQPRQAPARHHSRRGAGHRRPADRLRLQSRAAASRPSAAAPSSPHSPVRPARSPAATIRSVDGRPTNHPDPRWSITGGPETCRRRTGRMSKACAEGRRTIEIAPRSSRRPISIGITASRAALFRGHATLKAVAGTSFSLQAGRTLAVVGESGCGKSTLARMVTMIEKPTSRQSRHRRHRGGDAPTGPTAEGAAPQGADGVPGSLRLAQSPEAGRPDPGRAAGDQHHMLDATQRREAAQRHAGPRRLAARALQPLSAYVLRRPAPAHRHRPRA